MRYLNSLHDKRVNCYSIMVEMPVKDFLTLVEKSYENQGGIEGQRSALKTKTAITIRKRMVEDVKKGTVLPAIVLGVMDESFQESDLQPDSFKEFIDRIPSTSISIIDGMQRTTALKEILSSENNTLPNVRIEFWISNKLNSLIYRMLVLNTGQVPWEMARQLETIYSQLLASIKDNIPEDIEIFNKDLKPRRLSDNQFEAHKIIQLYIVFTSRRYDLNLKDKVAEDFARLDLIETNSIENLLEYFIKTFNLFSSLHKVFSNVNQGENKRIKSGGDIFKSDTALTGFFAAVSIMLFKKPGYEMPSVDIIEKKMNEINDNLNALIEKLNSKEHDELRDFLSLNALDERLNQKSGQVGKFERDLFFNAFTIMINDANELESLDPCWVS
ncbi:hypothetical protein A6B39_01840 [Mannheimia granulomatis]|uniref:hypothetical protein n=1 Tax=Mannheimia granulomatis TaxID=85402 RepID=UPI00159D0C76|nr:hypothetical protein [Mannheimia granulomatis]QLB14275.1 hypothetical protein A6B39_01840 [Mannheimia granulomatis]